jgi:hypothetical protein
VAAAAEISIEELRGVTRQWELARGRVSFTALAKAYGYKVMEIAAYLGKDPTAVS